jgi:hypothetical protein
LGPEELSIDQDFLRWIDSCVRLMNAHLPCLDAVRRFGHVYGSAVVAPMTTLPVVFETGKWNQGANSSLDGGARMALYQAREPWSQPQVPLTADWRFYRSSPITVQSMQESFDRLRALLERPSRADVLLRAELLQRARAAYRDGDFSAALIDAWAPIEVMLGVLLDRYLDKNEDRPVGQDASGNTLKFVNDKRRKFLKSSQMTVRHTIELLSFLDLLAFPLYQVVNRCEKARNAWLHNGIIPSRDIAWQAIYTCAQLFEQVEGVCLH